MPGYIYFASMHPQFVKIGYSMRPEHRIPMLHNGKNIPATSPTPCQPCDLIGVMPGTREDERDLHARFSPFRVAGSREWYWDVAGVRDLIAGLPLGPLPRNRSFSASERTRNAEERTTDRMQKARDISAKRRSAALARWAKSQ
jgi:hypothetical protein